MTETKGALQINPGHSARKVLVIRLAESDPFILALGAVSTLRKVHPHAGFDLLTTARHKAFAEACPYFDRVDAGGLPAGGKQQKALAARLASERYDIVYDFETSEASAKLFRRLARSRAAMPAWSGHDPKCALPHDRPDRLALPTIDRLADQLAQAGALSAESGPASVDRPDLRWIGPALGNPPRLQPAYFSLTERYILYAPVDATSQKALRWPMERHVEIARRIADAGIQPVIIGGPDESAVGQAIMREVPGAKSLIGRTDIFQLAMLSSHAVFVLGAAAEPIHMAALAGRPSLLLLSERIGDPDRDRPQGALSIVIHGETLKKVATDDVWQAVVALGVLPNSSPNA